MNKTFKAITPILLVVSGIIIIFLLISNKKKEDQINELQDEIDSHEDLNKEIKTRLADLVQNNSEIDLKIASELSQIVALLDIKQDLSAIIKLAKIIENLLEQLYKRDQNLKEVAIKNGRKKPVFSDYLEHAKNENLLSQEDFHLLNVLKIIRNEEAHELDVKKEKTRIVASFICGISFILGLCKRLKKNTLEKDMM